MRDIPKEIIQYQKLIDTHGTFNKENKEYTILEDGVYTVIKYFRAGETIKDPLLVTNQEVVNDSICRRFSK